MKPVASFTPPARELARDPDGGPKNPSTPSSHKEQSQNELNSNPVPA
jgi:hypothetical protein